MQAVVDEIIFENADPQKVSKGCHILVIFYFCLFKLITFFMLLLVASKEMEFEQVS